MAPPPMCKTAQRVSAGNILANHEDTAPTPVIRDASNLGTSVYDKLANNIGLLRTMFKENAQRPLCPHIDEIGPAIVRAFHFTEPDDVAAVYELLVQSQRATGHPVAEFESFSKTLREHAKRRETTARKALVKKQQMLALRGMKNAGGFGTSTNSGGGGQHETSGAAAAAASSTTGVSTPRGAPSSKAAAAAGSSGVPPLPPARTQSDWVGFLNQFSAKGDARLSWTEFAGAIHNLPPTWRRGQTLEPNDHWGARSFFMTSASVENLPQSTESRVSTASLSAYFVGNKTIARTSKSVALGSTIRNAMSWEDGGGGDDGYAPSSARRAGNGASARGAATATATEQQQPATNRAMRLRNESQKKWIIAHPTNPKTGNVERLPKLE